MEEANNPIFDPFILIILFTEKMLKKWWKTSKNKINEELIKIWVKNNMINKLWDLIKFENWFN